MKLLGTTNQFLECTMALSGQSHVTWLYPLNKRCSSIIQSIVFSVFIMGLEAFVMQLEWSSWRRPPGWKKNVLYRIFHCVNYIFKKKICDEDSSTCIYAIAYLYSNSWKYSRTQLSKINEHCVVQNLGYHSIVKVHGVTHCMSSSMPWWWGRDLCSMTLILYWVSKERKCDLSWSNLQYFCSLYK